MMDSFPYLYPYSMRDAKQRSELGLWRKSHQENIACKKAIEDAIRKYFDGMHLQHDCVESVIRNLAFCGLPGSWPIRYSKRIGTGDSPLETGYGPNRSQSQMRVPQTNMWWRTTPRY